MISPHLDPLNVCTTYILCGAMWIGETGLCPRRIPPTHRPTPAVNASLLWMVLNRVPPLKYLGSSVGLKIAWACVVTEREMTGLH